MKENDKKISAAKLRRQAEAKLKARKKKAQVSPPKPVETQRLIRELEVHQIELEMQNEELVRLQAKTESLLRQYSDLYDFAPVGSVTLAHNGAIRQINLSGARLLGVKREALIQRRFGLFVLPESRSTFNDFLEKAVKSRRKETCQIALLIKGSELTWVEMEAICSEDGQEFRAVLIDITERQRAEEQLRELNVSLDERVRARTAELARANVFTIALSQVAARLQATADPEQVIEALGVELGKLEITSFVALMEPDGQSLAIQHIALRSEVFKLAQKLMGVTLSQFRIIPARSSIWTEIVERKRITWMQDVVAVAVALLPGVPTPMLEQAIRLIGITHTTRSVGIPLLFEERLIGCLVMWGENLREEETAALLVFASQVAVALTIARLYTEVRQNTERLRALMHRLVLAHEDERARLARELHDEIGQALTSQMVDLHFIEHHAGNAEFVVARANEMKRQTNDVLENLHRLAMDLRPASLDHLGLVAALRQYIQIFAAQHNLAVQFQPVGFIGEHLRPEEEITLYRIAQEALTNIARHAQAQRAEVLLQRNPQNLILVIWDDGIGFDPQIVNDTGRLGLAGIRERAAMLGGTATLESAPGAGTTIRVEVPCDN